MQKKYFIVLGIVLIFLAVFSGMLLYQQSPRAPRQKIVVSPNNGSTAPTAAVPTLAMPPLGSTAKQATLQFYKFYVNSPRNPFANGAFQTNPYLAPEFKTVVAAGNGSVPVFCPQNIKRNVVVGQESTYYYDNGYLTSEVISEASPVIKNLYKVTLKNVNGKWLIFDVNCIP